MTAHKAVIAAIVGFLGSLLATLQGRTDLDTMSLTDWIIVVITAAVAGAATYAVPNRPKGTRTQP